METIRGGVVGRAGKPIRDVAVAVPAVDGVKDTPSSTAARSFVAAGMAGVSEPNRPVEAAGTADCSPVWATVRAVEF